MNIQDSSSQNNEKGGKSKMISKTISMNKELWDSCIEKAKSRGQSLSWIVRQLLEKWLKDEIKF